MKKQTHIDVVVECKCGNKIAPQADISPDRLMGGENYKVCAIKQNRRYICLKCGNDMEVKVIKVEDIQTETEV